MRRWVIVRGKVPVKATAGDLESIREEAQKLTQSTGVQHHVELFSIKYERLDEGACFRPVMRRGLGNWNLGPVCRKVNNVGQYEIVGVDYTRFPASPESYSMPSGAEVLPWGEREAS